MVKQLSYTQRLEVRILYCSKGFGKLIIYILDKIFNKFKYYAKVY